MTLGVWSWSPSRFSDSAEAKSRPAVVQSTRSFNRGGLSVMAMVTSARHSRMSGDIQIEAGTAGLPKDSVIRMKLFTLDNRLIRAKIGDLPYLVGERLGAQIRSVLRLG